MNGANVLSPAPNVQSVGDYTPAGRLLPILGGGDRSGAALALGRHAASLGETVLLLDGCDGKLMQAAGVIWNKTLGDVATGDAKLRDAMYVTANEHFTIAPVGRVDIAAAIALMAALSLRYDWVIVVGQASERVLSDTAIACFDTAGDGFMQAYWAAETLSARCGRTLCLSTGNRGEAAETAFMLRETCREFGGHTHYMGHLDPVPGAARLLAATVLSTLREGNTEARVA